MSQNGFVEPREGTKRILREQMGPLNDVAIDKFQRVFTVRSEPYYDNIDRFAPDWRLWNPQLLARMENQPMKILFNMAYADDYTHLNRILPDYYRNRGGVEAFARDIEKIGVQRGYHLQIRSDVQGQDALASLDGITQEAKRDLKTNVALSDSNPDAVDVQTLIAQLRDKTALKVA